MPQITDPTYPSVLVDKIRNEALAEGPKPHAFATPFRHSDGGGCARKLGFKYAGVPDTNPFDYASQWVAWLGTLIHEKWQDACDEKWGPDVLAEPPVHDPLWLASGSLDLLHDSNPGQRICVEAKTVNGTKYAMAIGVYKRGVRSKRNTAKGPSSSHVIQLALNTIDSDADFGVLFYLATEALSIQTMNGVNLNNPEQPMTEKERIMTQWTYTREELLPIAEAELARLTEVQVFVDRGILPAGEAVGDDGTIDHLDPRGDAWNCVYCSHKDICLEYSPGAVPFRPSDLEVRSKIEVA